MSLHVLWEALRITCGAYGVLFGGMLLAAWIESKARGEK